MFQRAKTKITYLRNKKDKHRYEYRMNYSLDQMQ